MAEDSLGAEIERAYQHERDERDERRGLETRGTTLLGSSVIAIGLVGAATRETASVAAWYPIVLAIPALLFGIATFALAAGLAGFDPYDERGPARRAEDLGFREFLRALWEFIAGNDQTLPASGDDVDDKPMSSLTPRERLDLHSDRASAIRRANARLVKLVRRATLAFGVAVITFAYLIALLPTIA